MKIAYISHAGRPCYELDWFSEIPAEEIRIIDTSFKHYPKKPSKRVKYCRVDSRHIVSLGSTAKLVRYKGYDKHLADIDAVIVLEIFSSLTDQFIRVCESKNIPVLALVYELIAEHPIYKLPPYSFFTKNSLNKVKHFIAISDLAKRHLIKLGADSEKISTIHPGIDTSAFKPQELAKSSHMDESVIFVGKLEKHKGIDIVIETFHKTIKTHPNRKMTIVGEGSYGHTVHGLAQNEDQLEYYPNIDNKRIPTLLNQHTTFIMPARDTYKLGLRVGAEQFCFSIVEAMACGLSIVTTDCGAIPEIAGPSAYICKQEQLDTFHDKVDLALRSHSLKISKQNASLAQENFNKRHQAELIHRQIERIT